MSENQSSSLDIIISIFTSKEIIMAIGGGFIGAIVSPWTKWHFRKKELKRDERKIKIEQWRSFLSNIESTDDLYKSHLYEELSSEIPPEEIQKLYKEATISVCIMGDAAVAMDNHDHMVLRLHKVISQKEKNWDLI